MSPQDIGQFETATAADSSAGAHCSFGAEHRDGQAQLIAINLDPDDRDLR